MYKWEGTDGEVIENIRLMSNNFEERACTLYLSMLLRHGVKIHILSKLHVKLMIILFPLLQQFVEFWVSIPKRKSPLKKFALIVVSH